jgi:esterase/lipase superfamily enzyme
MEDHVFARLLLILGVVMLGPSTGQTQATQAPDLPEPCRAALKDDLPTLENRKQRLEREIAEKTAALPPAADPRSKSLSEALRKDHEQLINMVFQIECLTIQQPQPSPVLTRRAVKAPSAKGLVEITTYYATNRNRSGASEPAAFYGAKVEGTLEYGRAVVTIPLTHSPGNIELPSLWRLEREDRNKHFVLKSVEPLSLDATRSEMADRLQTSGSKAILAFVHGYNVGFREAAMRTAQLAHDLKFAGVPFFYSWPSAARVTAYLQDADAAELSEGVFEQLVEDLSSLPASEIYLVAHSMGNRIVSKALRARVEKGKEVSKLRELVLAAPDINADLFRTVIAPKLAAMQGTRITVYASSTDLALRASRALHRFNRVGETIPGVFVYPQIETIDASSASSVIRAYGHSYIMDSQAVLKDIYAVFQQRVSAKQRGLAEVGTAPNSHWKLP